MEKSHGFTRVVFGICILLILFSCTPSSYVSFDSGNSFYVEIAKTSEEQQKGLMFRESMPENQGLLFIFDEEKPLSFWMKNTLIPLDIIFIDSNFTVVRIANAVPCKKEPCELYSSLSAMYVVELNQGIAEKNNIEIGSKLYVSDI